MPVLYLGFSLAGIAPTLTWVPSLSFKNYIAIQRDLRNSFADNLSLDEKETAYIAAIEKLAGALALPVEDVLNADNEFITKLVDVFLLQTK